MASGREAPLVRKAAEAVQRSAAHLEGEIDREARRGARGRGYCEVDGQVHMDELWACTTCAACVQACPVLIDSVPGTLLGLRQSLVMMESEFPAEATTAFKGMEIQGNPWGVGQDRRAGVGRGPRRAADRREGGREVEYLFWVGCAGATDPRARKTTQAAGRGS